jgi:hypothetical protein
MIQGLLRPRSLISSRITAPTKFFSNEIKSRAFKKVYDKISLLWQPVDSPVMID